MSYDPTAAASVLLSSARLAADELLTRRAMGHAPGCQCTCKANSTVPSLTGGVSCSSLRKVPGALDLVRTVLGDT